MPLRESTFSLHRVTELPLDLGHPVYEHYTTFKLGVGASVGYYARLLVPLVRKAIADPCCRDWVLTAPPYDAVRAGANLLCEAVDVLLQGSLPTGFESRRIDIRHHPVDPHHPEINRPYRYSSVGWRERRQSRAYWQSLTIDEPRFTGRDVIFVNDINVTGAQRDAMRRYFAGLGAASVAWVYIIDVDEAIGRATPELEEAINTSTPLSVEQLAELTAGCGIRVTSQCLHRLLSLDEPDFKSLLTLVGKASREELLRLVRAESRYRAPQFAAKLGLLQRACAHPRASPVAWRMRI